MGVSASEPGMTDDELRQPAARYAAGVDRRDRALFLSAFHPDATLTIPARDGGPGSPSTLRGHDELAGVVERIARYDRTFHFVGQALLEPINDDVTRGEVYCTAHHWRAAGDRTQDRVMYIRYADEYRRGTDGVWRIAERMLHVDAVDTHDVTKGAS